MPTKSARSYSIALIIGDLITLSLAFALAYFLRFKVGDQSPIAMIGGYEFLFTFLTTTPLWILVFASLGLYTPQVYSKRLTEIGKLLVGAFVGILIVLGYSFVTNVLVFPARLVAVYAFVAAFSLLVMNREIMRQLRTLLFRFGIGISRVLVVGNSDATRDIAEQLSNTQQSGYKIVAIAGPKSSLPKGFAGTHFSTVELALASLQRRHITTIIQTDLYESSIRNQRILQAAQERHISYCFVPGEAGFYSGKNTVDVFLGYPIIAVHQTPLVGWGEVVKRIFDVITTTILVILLSPIYLLLIILQKIFNPGPAFYINKRLTRYSKPFGLIKFRSMRAEFGKKDAAEEFKKMGRDDLVKEYELHRKVKNDPRITGFGKFLRATSLDELPQFFNVLKGDLSLVGPRPILPQELPFYRGKGALLHSVKSGVTGLWQVSGRSELAFEKRVELELYYAQNWSFMLDIKILVKTIPALFKKNGAL